MSGLRICRITRGFAPFQDGWSRHAVLLSEYQQRAGNDVFVLEPFDVPAKYVFRVAVPGRSWGQALGAKRDQRAFALEAANWLRRSPLRFDIIHVHGDVIDVHYASQAAKRGGIPLIATVHAGLNTSAPYRCLARVEFGLPSRLVAVSPQIACQLEDMGVQHRRIRVLSSGIETSALKTERTGPNRRDVRVVATGRLVQYKGFRDLVAAFLTASLPPESSLTLLGDGPQRRVLESLAGGNPRVRLLGERPHEEVVGMLKSADVFVMPSIDLKKQSEGTPTALLEAMAAGLPCIVTQSGGMTAVVEDGRNGIVVPQRDPARIASALSELAADSELRLRLGRNAEASVQDRDWSCVAARVLAVCHEALREAGRNEEARRPR